MITATDLSLTLAGRHILGPIDVHLQAGCTSVLLGPNGAGKSSLVRLLSGIESPSSGDVRVNDRAVSSLAPLERARCLGVLTQHSALEFPFTAAEVIAMGRTPFGDVPGNARVIDELLSYFSINAAQVYTTMSGGERQLVQMARVLAQIWNGGDAAYLMLDEPMTALDLRHQASVVTLLSKLAGAGTGQLIVMHDINLAAAMADEVILMSKGEIVCQGRPEEVMTAARISDVFETRVEVVDATGLMFRTLPGDA